jgi:cytochrome c oxidase cbb3-type subunit 2
MNPFVTFRAFFTALLASFLFTWLALVVFPWLELGHLPPIQDEGSTDITPWDAPGAAHQGERIYAANGCAYCHTQQVRPPSSGADIIRGWGTAKDADGKDVVRRSYPGLYRYLYDPYLLNPHSSMPAFHFLFVTRKISGQASEDALVLPEADAPPAGYEIVPTAEARSLVAYLLSLKKGYHLKPDEAGVPYIPPSTTKS